MKAYYVLYALDAKAYFTSKFESNQNYKEAMEFESKQDAIDFMAKNQLELREIDENWTTREFFKL